MLVLANESEAARCINEWLGNYQQFVKLVHSIIPEMNLACAYIFWRYTLDVVSKLFDWSLERHLMKHFQDAYSVQQIVWDNLVKKISPLNVVSESEFSTLIRLIMLLHEFCERTQIVASRAALGTSRIEIILIEHCAKWLDQDHETATRDYRQQMQLVAERCFRFHLQVLVKVTNQKLPNETDDLKIYTRLIQYEIFLLQKLTANFKHERFPVVKEFIETCIALTSSNNFQNEESSNIKSRIIKPGVSNMLCMIYKNRQVPELLVNHLKESKLSVNFSLIQEFLKASLWAEDESFILSNIEVYITIFEELIKVSDVFNKPANFETVIEIYAAFTIWFGSPFKKYIRANVLRADFPLANASVEVLLTVFRCNLHTPNHDELPSEFEYWCRCNEKFALFSSNTKRLHVQRLLTSYFQLYECYRGESESILQKLGLNAQNSDKFSKLLLTLGLETAGSKENVLQLDKYTLSVENYYGQVYQMELLATSTAAPAEQILSNTFERMLKIYSLNRAEQEHFERFLQAGFKVATMYAANPQPRVANTLQGMLEEIECCLSKQKAAISVPMLHFLSACWNTAKLRDGVHRIFRNMVSTPDLYYFAFPVDLLPNNPNIAKLDQIRYVTSSCPHVCKSSTASDACIQSIKRLRSEADVEEDLKTILSELSQKSQQLLDVADRMNYDDVYCVNTIVYNLNSALKKKQRKEFSK